ncbi:MAG: hypothetical protein M9892_07315 [Bacteroidetes bacterium]|nr:hypothetical protein [Bacteroidota bacterium]
MLSVCSVGALAETALLVLLTDCLFFSGVRECFAFADGLACAVGAKANEPFAGRHKIELKKMCGWENKKYRRVGNECLPVRQTGRITRCPFEIWYVCWSPVKMVCPC